MVSIYYPEIFQIKRRKEKSFHDLCLIERIRIKENKKGGKNEGKRIRYLEDYFSIFLLTYSDFHDPECPR
jgi:hypothetical protein